MAVCTWEWNFVITCRLPRSICGAHEDEYPRDIVAEWKDEM
jgi:hypothetical protein